MFANMGQQIGGMIQQYGLNKEKRERNENTAVGTLLGMAQNDQPSLSALMQNKDFAKAAESIRKGEGTAKQVDLVNSSTAAYRTQQMAGMQQKMSELNLSLQEALKDPTIKKAVAQANLAEAEGNYANSIVSEKYAGMVQDNALKSAQTAHQELLTKALENKEQYTPGQVVDIEGPSGEKVRFYYSGETLQPLNDGKYIKDINKAIIQGVDPAELEAYIDRTYDVVDGQLVHKKDTKFGFGDAPKKNPLMEQAIAILALYDVDKKDSAVSKEPTPTAEATIDEHKSANEEAKSRGKMFYILNGKKFTVQ
jgi:hypothetical protein